MKRKSIKVDWGELETAFNNRNEEIVYYLDRVTGQVVLEGEGEDLFEDDDELLDDVSASDGPLRNDTTRLYIEPPDADEELSWLHEFLREAEDLDPGIRERLEETEDDDDSDDAARHVLRDHPEIRQRWFAYRTERMHEAMEAWLDANEVRSTEPPPWRN
jgi:hypothetical protein